MVSCRRAVAPALPPGDARSLKRRVDVSLRLQVNPAGGGGGPGDARTDVLNRPPRVGVILDVVAAGAARAQVFEAGLSRRQQCPVGSAGEAGKWSCMLELAGPGGPVATDSRAGRIPETHFPGHALGGLRDFLPTLTMRPVSGSVRNLRQNLAVAANSCTS